MTFCSLVVKKTQFLFRVRDIKSDQLEQAKLSVKIY